MEPLDLNYSPITGASSKNIEFLIRLKYRDQIKDFDRENWKNKILKVIESAHLELGG